MSNKKDSFQWEFFMPRAAPKTKAELENRVALFKRNIFVGISNLTGVQLN